MAVIGERLVAHYWDINEMVFNLCAFASGFFSIQMAFA